MGLEVKLIISKKQQEEEAVAGDDTTNADGVEFDMQVESTGKFSRKANWEDLKQFTGKEMTSDVLKDMIVTYQEKCFPDDAAKPNSTPKKCFIKDEKGSTLYKDFGWKPIKLNLTTGMVDIKEQWTKEIVVETFPLDYTTNLEQLLLEKGDKKVTSILRKSKLAGHVLAKEMMKTKSEIVTEFKGELDATTCVLGNTAEPSEVDEETGDEVWKDVKSLRALLYGATLPKKSGVGVTRDVDVLANESYLKARVYYRAAFVNDVATDHVEPFDGKPFWKFPIKYLFQYNGIPNAAVVYEDIELRFFTDVRIAMENKDFEWVKDEGGQWKKQYSVKTTSVSHVKPKIVSSSGKTSTPSKEANEETDVEEETTVATEVPVEGNPSSKIEASKRDLNASETEEVAEPEEVEAKSPGVVDEVKNDSRPAAESATETADLDGSMSWINNNSSLMSPVPKSGGKSANSIASIFSPGAGSVSSDQSQKSPKPDPDGLNLSAMNMDNVDVEVPFSPKRDP
mmetsp:Transcript_51387/g.124061  ORF Transcript_51387/g.124061 Transcript_51387/m.124061 type:complete len:510 (+) Transcript_51387:135-1664(+)